MAFVREKTSNGYTYYQLVKSERVNGHPRQKILAYLGKDRTLEDRIEYVRDRLNDTRWHLAILERDPQYRRYLPPGWEKRELQMRCRHLGRALERLTSVRDSCSAQFGGNLGGWDNVR